MELYEKKNSGVVDAYKFDKYPDIQIGAYPNRLIIYNATRFHAACNDFSFKETYKLNIFFNLLQSN